jgi:hypothetical protein
MFYARNDFDYCHFKFQIGPVAHPPKEKDSEATKTQNEINGTKF